MTPDWAAKPVTVPYASFGDPQTLNLYTYVENAPVNRVDADGHFWLDPLFGFAADKAKAAASQGEAEAKKAEPQNKKDPPQPKKGFWASLTGALAVGVARISPAAARKLWEAANPGEKVPFDAVRGRFYDMAHNKALTDGGTNAAENLKPQEHAEHMAEHMENGDFARWGARAKEAVTDAVKATGAAIEGAASGATEILIIVPMPAPGLLNPRKGPDSSDGREL